MKLSRVREILKRFKDLCKLHGWKTSEKDDWVETKKGYHNFLSTRSIHPSSFKSIATNRKCVVREGLSYRVVEASYTAWLLSESPSEMLIRAISENPDFSKKIALYDLSPISEGKNLGFKLNHTDSLVFREFENFLKKEMKVKLSPIRTPETDSEEHAVTKLA